MGRLEELIIPIKEIFYSIQGEIDVGMPALFIRVAGCNMEPPCDFCDTKYSLLGGDKYTVSRLIEVIANYKRTNPIRNVVWTGGEPLKYIAQINECINFTPDTNHYLETNGLKYFDLCKKFTGISVSPKKQNINFEALRNYSKLPQTRFKFVYEIKNNCWWEPIILQLKILPEKVWIMPEGADRRAQFERSKEVIEYCKRTGYNFATRLHILIYDKKRGI